MLAKCNVNVPKLPKLRKLRKYPKNLPKYPKIIGLDSLLEKLRKITTNIMLMLFPTRGLANKISI
jgi:hypothetical protein